MPEARKQSSLSAIPSPNQGAVRDTWIGPQANSGGAPSGPVEERPDRQRRDEDQDEQVAQPIDAPRRAGPDEQHDQRADDRAAARAGARRRRRRRRRRSCRADASKGCSRQHPGSAVEVEAHRLCAAVAAARAAHGRCSPRWVSVDISSSTLMRAAADAVRQAHDIGMRKWHSSSSVSSANSRRSGPSKAMRPARINTPRCA